MSRACQGLVKGLSRACQGLVKGPVKGLSRACQGLVKGLSRAPLVGFNCGWVPLMGHAEKRTKQRPVGCRVPPFVMFTRWEWGRWTDAGCRCRGWRCTVGRWSMAVAEPTEDRHHKYRTPLRTVPLVGLCPLTTSPLLFSGHGLAATVTSARTGGRGGGGAVTKKVCVPKIHALFRAPLIYFTCFPRKNFLMWVGHAEPSEQLVLFCIICRLRMLVSLLLLRCTADAKLEVPSAPQLCGTIVLFFNQKYSPHSAPRNAKAWPASSPPPPALPPQEGKYDQAFHVYSLSNASPAKVAKLYFATGRVDAAIQYLSLGAARPTSCQEVPDLLCLLYVYKYCSPPAVRPPPASLLHLQSLTGTGPPPQWAMLQECIGPCDLQVPVCVCVRPHSPTTERRGRAVAY